MTSNVPGIIKAIIVEDEIKIGTYIKHKIETLEPSIQITALAENGKEALDLMEAHHPHLVFTDIAMPVMDGLKLSEIIKNRYPGTVVVIISGYSDFAYAQQAIRHGVFNYILKPLEDDKLSDVLYDVKKSLLYTTDRPKRQVLYSDSYLFDQNQDVKYAVFSICVGNLIYDMQDIELAEYYRDQMQQIPWNKAMEEVCKTGNNWYLADEQAINQKLAGIQIEKTKGLSLIKTALQLGEAIGRYTKLSVHVFSPQNMIEYDDVWNMAKYLRHEIQQNLVVGHTQILSAEQAERSISNGMEIVKMKLTGYIQNYFETADLKAFMDEMQIILKYMIKNRMTQIHIEKICLYILKLLEFSDGYCDGEFLETMRIKLQRGIGLAPTEEALSDCMMGCFREIGSYMEQVCEKNIEERVLEYVDAHFLTLESMEQVADALGYNYTYLSRLFKKITDVPASKYITGKKIALAKQLLKAYPDMVLDDICELCGYRDAGYFSRVFKKSTGMSPGEYRMGKADSSSS